MNKSLPKEIATFVYNNSMSIALLGLFLVCVAGASLTGWSAYNQALSEGHYGPIAFRAYLKTGQFLDGIFSNWQAAILQLGVLITFGSILRQKGAAHSRKPDEEGTLASHQKHEWKFAPRFSLGAWIYANSLSLTFAAFFLACFVAHAVFGSWKYNEDQMLRRLALGFFTSYVRSTDFWFTVFQTWEAEFFAIGFYIVLSIFLRQQDSSESKPVEASNEQTGGVNE